MINKEFLKIDIDKIKKYSRNNKKHGENVQEIMKSIVANTYIAPIIIDEENTILAGHGRYEAMKKLGEKNIDILKVTGLTTEQKRDYRLRDNKITELSERDIENIKFELDELQIPDLTNLFDFGNNDTLEAVEDDYIIPDEIKTDIVLGDLFEIGEHRLLCGDSTCSDTVAKLMNGEKIDMVFTSPPYNSGGNSGTGGYRGNKSRKTKDFYNEQEKSDNWTKEEYFDFCISIFNNISVNCNDDTSILWNVMYNANSRDDYGKIIFSDINPFTVKETIIWDKGVGMNICSTGILSRTCELIFLLSKGDKYYTNQNNDTYWNTWRISNKQGENMKWGHGASFPIALPFEGIEKFSKEGFNVYEPFTGSGTTMVASHQLKRKCYGMELDPNYCQVIVDRMIKLDPTIKIKKNGQDFI